MVLALLAAIGSAFLWWRTSHIDRNGQIPKPALAIHVPGLLLQATARENGLHFVCLTGYPKRNLQIQFERQTYIHEPGYARANSISGAGFRFVILTRTLNETDSILFPFGAVVCPYWFLVSFFSCLFVYLLSRIFRSSLKNADTAAHGSSSAAPAESAKST
jgi:hypothetical protein